jgi:hypothetical protein
VGATAAITGIGVLSAYLGGESAKEKASYEKSMFEANANFAEIQANRVLENADIEAGQYKKKIRGMVGSQRAGYAGQGVSVDYGTAGEMQAETMEIGARDVETIRNNAALEAYGLRIGAQNSRRQGEMGVRAANNVANNSLITAGLQGATSYYSRRS